MKMDEKRSSDNEEMKNKNESIPLIYLVGTLASSVDRLCVCVRTRMYQCPFVCKKCQKK